MKERNYTYDDLLKFYSFHTTSYGTEVWRPVPDCPDYQVSNWGRVKSFKCGKVKILVPTIYRDFTLVTGCKNRLGELKTLRIHRLVAKVFVPNPDNLTEVTHKDGNKFNNRASNLQWVKRRKRGCILWTT